MKQIRFLIAFLVIQLTVFLEPVYAAAEFFPATYMESQQRIINATNVDYLTNTDYFVVGNYKFPSHDSAVVVSDGQETTNGFLLFTNTAGVVTDVTWLLVEQKIPISNTQNLT